MASTGVLKAPFCCTVRLPGNQNRPTITTMSFADQLPPAIKQMLGIPVLVTLSIGVIAFGIRFSNVYLNEKSGIVNTRSSSAAKRFCSNTLTLSICAVPKEIPFTTPTPTPAEDFDLKSTDPKLYRPFRHGANYITMGIRRLDWSNWIEMDSNFLRYHDLKVSELNKDLHSHVKYVDNKVTIAACFEVYEELVQFLTRRYPKIFKLNGNELSNTATGEIFQYPACEDP